MGQEDGDVRGSGQRRGVPARQPPTEGPLPTATFATPASRQWLHRSPQPLSCPTHHPRLATGRCYGSSAGPEVPLSRWAQVPAFIRADGESVFESAVILGYLEDKYSALRPAFVQGTPEQRQRMQLIMRCHDVYIASPNCTAPGFSHTQGTPSPPLPVRSRRPAHALPPSQARCTCPSASTALHVGWI